MVEDLRLRGFVGEILPELLAEETRGERALRLVVEDQINDGVAVEIAGHAVDSLIAVIVPAGRRRVVVDIGRQVNQFARRERIAVEAVSIALLDAVFERPAREGARRLLHIGLGVRALLIVLKAQREQLHQFARVVFIRTAEPVELRVEPFDHRRIAVDPLQHRAEIGGGLIAEELILPIKPF
ncbi:MAG: hypothetical protein JMDDDDMK_00391 [Acidobacteria bacterium]|nr:hypothetical protein [Acidobacteriota bacterium]